MGDPREGGCQCGAVRYRLEGEPVALVACHCSECQRQSGSAFGMSLIVSKDAFQLLSGEPKQFDRTADSGRSVECAFCPACGTRIYHEPTYRKDTLNIKTGTLDCSAGEAAVAAQELEELAPGLRSIGAKARERLLGVG